jgi:uncharacterized membrane protein
MFWEVPLLNSLHLLLAVIWVGGMFFAWVCLRPVAGREIQGLQRARLWHGVLARFLGIVWLAAIGLPLTGYRMAFYYFGGPAGFPLYVNLMQALGWLMIFLFAYVFFGPWRRLGQAIRDGVPENAADALGRIRRAVGFNLLLGLLLVAMVGAGRILGF